MGVSILSFDQIEELRSSRYVASITARQVSFTKEFKQHFYEEYMQGKPPKEILRDILNVVLAVAAAVSPLMSSFLPVAEIGCGLFLLIVMGMIESEKFKVEFQSRFHH